MSKDKRPIEWSENAGVRQIAHVLCKDEEAASELQGGMAFALRFPEGYVMMRSTANWKVSVWCEPSANVDAVAFAESSARVQSKVAERLKLYGFDVSLQRPPSFRHV